MRHRLVTIVVLAGALFCTRESLGDTHRTASLSWVELPGAEACGGATAMARAVEERLGRHALVSPSQADVSIEVRAERSGDPPRWHAVLALRDASGAIQGTRQIDADGPDCEELRGEVALAVALMVDPDAALGPAPSAAPASPAPPPPPPPRVEPPRVEAPGPRSAWRLDVSGSGAIAGGVLPSLAVGGLAALTLISPRLFALETFGGGWGSQSVGVQGNASVRFSSAFWGLGVCLFHAQGAGLLFEACAGGETTFLGGQTEGFPTSQSNSSVIASLFADAHLSGLVAGPVWIRLGAGVAPAVARSRFVYDVAGGTKDVFAPSAVAATTDLGLEIALP